MPFFVLKCNFYVPITCSSFFILCLYLVFFLWIVLLLSWTELGGKRKKRRERERVGRRVLLGKGLVCASCIWICCPVSDVIFSFIQGASKEGKKGSRRGVNKKTPCMRVTDVEYLLQGVHIVAEVGGGEHRNRSRGRKGGRNCTIFFGA